jgi:hypothetical protein
MSYQKFVFMGLVMVLLASCATAAPTASLLPTPLVATATEAAPTTPIIEVGQYTCSMLSAVNLSRQPEAHLSTVLELLQVYLILDEDLTVMAYDATQYELLVSVDTVVHPIQGWLDGLYDSRSAQTADDIVIYHDDTPICWGLFPLPTE